MSTITETLSVHYFCLGKAPARAVGSRNFKKYEQDLHVAIGDSVGLHKSSGLFKVLDLSLFVSHIHRSVLKPMVSFSSIVIHGALVCLHILF